MNYYDLTVPVFIRFLTNLLALLKKAESHARKRNIDVAVFLQGRLAPDQYNLIQQVQYSYFLALDAACGLTGKKPPALAYDEKTLPQLEKSIRTVIRFLKTLTKSDFENPHRVSIFWKPKKTLAPLEYVTRIGLPDFFFHYTTAYSILRHLGVSIGKDDFLGSVEK